MARYHINLEGKIYPCRAKIFKCPYEESNHADNKIDLYYTLMGLDKGDVEPSEKAMEELRELKRLKSLYSLSDELEETNAPIELITQTLRRAIEVVVDSEDTVKKNEKDWERYANKEAEEVYEVLNHGLPIPENVPKEIAEMGRDKFYVRRNGIPIEYAYATGNTAAKNMQERMERKSYLGYNNFKKWELNNNNMHGTKRWLVRDFEKFTHDLNTSKMITQPIFYGDIEQAKKTISELDDYELLSAFDDYSVTDREIEDNVKEANYFKYEYRKDLTKEANKKVKEWYDRNREIYRNWKVNTSKRVLLSMEIAEELDRRGISRPDVAVAKMMREREV